tara:strand:+ start:319 stop:747 length:429 start_codon:yes stop_codon:yes gene_type:complete
MVKLRHVGLAVVDMDISLKLYQGIFNLNVVWDQIESGTFIDRLSDIKDVKVRTVKLKDVAGGMVELLQYISHPESVTPDPINRIGCSHIAITVDDIDSMYNILTEFGCVFNYIPQLSADGNAKVAFCRDSDGILIEVVEQVK